MDINGDGNIQELRQLPLTRFENNTAHSNALAGLRVYRLGTKTQSNSGTIEGLSSWRNGERGAQINANNLRIQSSLIFGNGEANVTLNGKSNVIESTHIMGELHQGTTTISNTKRTPTGIKLTGLGHSVVDSILEGHSKNNNGDIGSDIKLAQDTKGPMTATIRNSMMKSSRTIIFGYPMNDRSKITVLDYQQVQGDDFTLYRLDATPQSPCTPNVDLDFVSKVCLQR